MGAVSEEAGRCGAGPPAAGPRARAAPPAYAELHCLSNFTFLRGASHPRELVDRAHALDYRALAITDECSVAGVVRAHLAAKANGLTLIIGAEFRLRCGLAFVALATDRHGYGSLCRLITRGRRAAEKGRYDLGFDDVDAILERCLMLWLPPADLSDEAHLLSMAGRIRERFAGDAWLAVELLREGDDAARLAVLTRIGGRAGLPLVASGDVHMHVRARRRLQDALTAIRLGVPVADAGYALHRNGERYLRERGRLARIYPAPLLAASAEVAARCRFSLDELCYEYPREVVPAGETPASHLRSLVQAGARHRWPQGVPAKVRSLIEHELALIAELRYEPYFLTVHDIVQFARGAGILCQGRGSAANSAVCYSLGITEVDPAHMQMLMERFISRERNEPPDIDIDFEHERREEVIQYIYRKYGRERTALTATVISYRPRSALRDLGKALGLDPEVAARLASGLHWWDPREEMAARAAERGFDASSPVLTRLFELARELLDFPRHLSQHVGGFVISEGPLEELVPIENAAMPERTVIEWDKDDLDALRLLKVDVLGLGMLAAIRRALGSVAALRGAPFTLADVPQDDPAVYDMLCRADTIGVFQVESRAQMSMLPRLKPRNYFDLVIQVAIVRPGPIQGGMVHPYLRRREGVERIEYPGPEAQEVLERTLGVPLFQEQVMQLAIRAAGFTPGEADQLRRSMAAWKRHGGLAHFRDKLIDGLLAHGYERKFAEQIFEQIKGFGEYGFPESHAASFALLVYVSAWLKHHEPAAFTCALLNSQPMGFYAPAQLVRDARAHGVDVRPVTVEASRLESTLEDGRALRLGLHLVAGFGEAAAQRLVAARAERPFGDVQDLAARAALARRELEALAAADALAGLAGHRHGAFWDVAGHEPPLPTAPRASAGEGTPLLVAPTEARNIVADYRSTGLTLRRHPLALLRERFAREGLLPLGDLPALAGGHTVRVAGLVLTRQRPGTASGVTFVTIEDETGQANLVVWERVGRTQRRALTGSRLLEVHGRLQRQGEVLHVVARRLIDRSALIGALRFHARNFH
ncbi:MAG: Error-prone DNA polymerase [Steroidobacteraceae bacterium]|nr:Error-prone DNA polymerase [Steroidobacteraceae bacterium]